MAAQPSALLIARVLKWKKASLVVLTTTSIRIFPRSETARTIAHVNKACQSDDEASWQCGTELGQQGETWEVPSVADCAASKALPSKLLSDIVDSLVHYCISKELPPASLIDGPVEGPVGKPKLVVSIFTISVGTKPGSVGDVRGCAFLKPHMDRWCPRVVMQHTKLLPAETLMEVIYKYLRDPTRATELAQELSCHTKNSVWGCDGADLPTWYKGFITTVLARLEKLYKNEFPERYGPGLDGHKEFNALVSKARIALMKKDAVGVPLLTVSFKVATEGWLREFPVQLCKLSGAKLPADIAAIINASQAPATAPALAASPSTNKATGTAARAVPVPMGASSGDQNEPVHTERRASSQLPEERAASRIRTAQPKYPDARTLSSSAATLTRAPAAQPPALPTPACEVVSSEELRRAQVQRKTQRDAARQERAIAQRAGEAKQQAREDAAWGEVLVEAGWGPDQEAALDLDLHYGDESQDSEVDDTAAPPSPDAADAGAAGLEDWSGDELEASHVPEVVPIARPSPAVLKAQRQLEKAVAADAKKRATTKAPSKKRSAPAGSGKGVGPAAKRNMVSQLAPKARGAPRAIRPTNRPKDVDPNAKRTRQDAESEAAADGTY